MRQILFCMVDSQILSFYAKGMTMREIVATFKERCVEKMKYADPKLAAGNEPLYYRVR